MTKNVLCVFKRGDKEHSQQLGWQLHSTSGGIYKDKSSLWVSEESV